MTDRSYFKGIFGGVERHHIAIWGIVAGTLLMLVSMFAPSGPDGSSAAQDVLPFATGLIGFLAGLYATKEPDKPGNV
jgi:hypothetical protein